MKMRSTRQLAYSRIRCTYSDSPFTRIPNAVKQQMQRCFRYLFREESEQNCNKVGSSGQVQHLKEGHFTVLAKGNGEQRKFFVALSYLRHPSFLKLLEAAEHEFGFDQPGVLVIPCEASELQEILS